jgi:hypothetical protein
MSKSLPPVHPINVDALSKKFGMLEETRAELLKQKDKYPNDSVERSTIEQQIISIDNKQLNLSPVGPFSPQVTIYLKR